MPRDLRHQEGQEKRPGGHPGAGAARRAHGTHLRAGHRLGHRALPGRATALLVQHLPRIPGAL
eukprot:9095962-Lingulodinium_polyedra.AAC.1